MFLKAHKLLLTILIVSFWNWSVARHQSVIRCKENERQALLRFKQGLKDPYDLLFSWELSQEDCCSWKGITCHNQTHSVIALDLRSDPFVKRVEGEISSSLLELQHLSYLDLSGNTFSIFPNFIGSFANLNYLNLSFAGHNGRIPFQMRNLSRLVSIDLSQNYYLASDFKWFSHLYSLKFFDMSDTDVLSMSSLELQPSLEEIRLSGCKFSSIVPSTQISRTNLSNNLSLQYADFSSNSLDDSSTISWLFKNAVNLHHLDLSYNLFEGSIPDSIGNMISLLHLDLSGNYLNGSIPNSLGNMISLFYLDLSINSLTGSVPHSLGNMVSLTHLDLSANNLQGPIPSGMGNMVSLVLLHMNDNGFQGEIPQGLPSLLNLEEVDLSNNKLSRSVPDLTYLSSLRSLRLSNNILNGSLTQGFGQLSQLRFLDVSSNFLAGILTEAHFSNLSSLFHLDMSHNSLSWKFDPSWIPPFNLKYIKLTKCHLGPSFPQWIRTQINAQVFDISEASISDTIPNMFFVSPMFEYLNLLYNQMYGSISNLSADTSRDFTIDLSNNNFTGLLPIFPSSTIILALSNNFFQGSITPICNIATGNLEVLDLSDNLLSGGLPDCWNNTFRELRVLDLANNNFYGKVPNSLWSSLPSLQWLRLSNNNFSGLLSASITNSTLSILDLEGNRFYGKIPELKGQIHEYLLVLSLRSNYFNGRIPLELCDLSNLQILDLSNNMLQGTIPKFIGKLNAMTQIRGIDHLVGSKSDTLYTEFTKSRSPVRYPPIVTPEFLLYKVFIVWKHFVQKYDKTLGLVKVIDLSRNQMAGAIPKQITKLIGLKSLNLSRNFFTGIIPSNIGIMESLESLDLSRNHLFGEIPPSLSNLNYLGTLELSFNNLSGPIPTGSQLQGFLNSYEGNLYLCGPPKNKSCQPPLPGGSVDGGSQDENSFPWLYFSIGTILGFVIGFWGVFGSLLLKQSWKYAYFQFAEKIGNYVYVVTVVRMFRLQRMFKTQN